MFLLIPPFPFYFFALHLSCLIIVCSGLSVLWCVIGVTQYMLQLCPQDSSCTGASKSKKRRLDTSAPREDTEAQKQIDALTRRMGVTSKFSPYMFGSAQVGIKQMNLTPRERDCCDGFFMTQLLKHASTKTAASSESESSPEPAGVIDVSQSFGYKAWSPVCLAQNSKIWCMKEGVMLSGSDHLICQGWSHDQVRVASSNLTSKQCKEIAGEGMALQQLGIVMWAFWMNYEAPWWP